MPSRGSLTCISSAVATICLMRSARRRALPASAMAMLPSVLGQVIIIEQPPAHREQLDLRPAGNEPLAAVQHLDHMGMRRGHRATDTSARRCRSSAPVSAAATSIPPAQLRDHRPHDRPLVLQRPHVTQQQITDQSAHDHCRVPFDMRAEQAERTMADPTV